MSETDYELAVSLTQQHQHLADFVGKRSEALITSAEIVLGLTFPTTYKRFLQDFGAGSFGAFEIYGVITPDFEQSGVPDAIWITLTERNAGDLPDNLLIVHAVGDGALICIDCRQLNAQNEARLVDFELGLSLAEQSLSVVASDFGEFFLSMVEKQIAI